MNSTPSMRTGSSAAFVRSAMTAGPSYTFINDPVVVMRPSGKMMQAEPASTARIIARMESGFVGSTGSALTNSEERLRPPLLRDQGVDREDRIARQERAEQQSIKE